MAVIFQYPPAGDITIAGGATEAKQDVIIANQDDQTAILTDIEAGIPEALGQQLMAASMPVVIASNQSTLAVSAASLPLPADAATETTLSALNAKVVAVDTGAVVISSALPAGTNNIGDVDVVSLPSIPAGTNNIGDVDVLSLPSIPAGSNNIGSITNITGTISLPTDAATATNQAAAQTTLDNIRTSVQLIDDTVGQPNSSLPTKALLVGGTDGVDFLALSTNSSGEAIVVVTQSALPADASTETTLSALNSKVPSNLTVASTRLLVDGSGVTQPVSNADDKASTATLANVSASTSSVTLQASNSARKGFTIHNDSSSVLYVKFGSTASSTSYTVKLVSDAYYELPTTSVYTGIITGIWVSATGSARCTELT